MDELLHFKMQELSEIIEGLNKKEIELKNSLKHVSASKNTLVSILNRHGVEDKNSSIILPKKVFDNFSISNVSLKFNWKKLAFEIIKNQDNLLSTDEIYVKAKIKHPVELIDRRKSIQNFSASLYYLLSEGKIIREKKNNKFFYGLSIKHFDKKIHDNVL